MTKAQELDQKVQGLMEQVKKQRKELGDISKPHWITSCRIKLPGLDNAINIQVEQNTTSLASAIGTLKRMADDIKAVEKELGVSVPAVLDNYQIEDWITDIKLRINIINKQAKQKKLANMEKKLKPLLSEDQRREMALAEIESEL